MAVSVETVGANGMPPSVMVFQVVISEQHLASLLGSAERMPQGERSVPGHLRDALVILLTDIAVEHPSDQDVSTAGSSDGGAAPTRSAGKSSKAKTVRQVATEDDVDAVKA